MTRPSLTATIVWLLAVLMVAAIVHISSIFLLPSVAAQNAYARLSQGVDEPGFRILPVLEPGDASLPFTDPGTTLAVCRFDLGSGPWRIRVDIDSEALTSLSFRGRGGTVFHTLIDRAALRGRLDVFLGTAAQIDAAEANDTDDSPVREVRLAAPSPVGLVFIRAMASSPAGGAGLRRRMESAECRPAG